MAKFVTVEKPIFESILNFSVATVAHLNCLSDKQMLGSSCETTPEPCKNLPRSPKLESPNVSPKKKSHFEAIVPPPLKKPRIDEELILKLPIYKKTNRLCVAQKKLDVLPPSPLAPSDNDTPTDDPASTEESDASWKERRKTNKSTESQKLTKENMIPGKIYEIYDKNRKEYFQVQCLENPDSSLSFTCSCPYWNWFSCLLG